MKLKGKRRSLGGGGSGATVFRCSVRGFSFAAKVLNRMATPDEYEPLVKEIAIMMQLQHDNIVCINGLFFFKSNVIKINR